MKKIFNDGYTVYLSDDFMDIKKHLKIKLPYPFEEDIINLLKKVFLRTSFQ